MVNPTMFLVENRHVMQVIVLLIALVICIFGAVYAFVDMMNSAFDVEVHNESNSSETRTSRN